MLRRNMMVLRMAISANEPHQTHDIVVYVSGGGGELGGSDGLGSMVFAGVSVPNQ